MLVAPCSVLMALMRSILSRNNPDSFDPKRERAIEMFYSAFL